MEPRHGLGIAGGSVPRTLLRAAGTAALAVVLGLGSGAPAVADISGVLYNPGTGHYYKYVASTGYWGAAKSGAESLGGYLCAVNSDAERVWLETNIRPSNTSCYIGGSDTSTEGAWTWVSGEPWSYTYWNSGEPNNSGDEDYLMVNNNGTWNDIHGSYNLPGYIVEWNVNPNIPPPPAAPTNLTAEFSGTSSILLNWEDHSSNEDAFEVWRATSSGTFTRIANLPADTTFYEDPPKGPSSTFTWRVRAVNLGGASAYTNDAQLTTPEAPVPPAPPTDLQVTDTGSHTLSFQWTDNGDDEVQYQILRRTLDTDFAIVGIAPPDTTHFDDTGLAPDTAYVYGVRSVNSHGPSSRAELQASTVATLALETVRADLTDSPKLKKDKIKIVTRYSPVSEGGAEPDPVADGFTLRAGPEESPVALTVLPGDYSWKVKNGKAKWKSPKDSASKYAVLWDLNTYTVTVTGKSMELDEAAANPMRVSLSVGEEGGSQGMEWFEKKPGKFQFRPE